MIVCFFDGACWPNPGGKAAYGVYIRDGSETLLQEGFNLGAGETMSCNVAEYSGVIRILEFLKQQGYTDRKIIIRGDSNLVINQLAGKWKVKAGLYVDAALQAKMLAKEFTDVSFEWILREQNTICDELAEIALE